MSPRPNPHPVFGVTTVGGATAEKECNCIRELMSILGDADGDLCFLLPFFEGTLGAAADVQDVSSRGLHALNVVAVDNVPVIRGDMLSVRLNGVDEYLSIADNILLTPIVPPAGVDVPFSVGCAVKTEAGLAAIQSLIAKWDGTPADYEWRLSLTALDYPALEVADSNVVTSNMGREDQTAIESNVWYIIIGTYNGVGGPAPEAGINVYRWDGATHGWDGAVDDADIDGGGVYVDMENTAELVFIGADNTGGAAANFVGPGEIMLPWYTRRELSADDARRAALTMVRIMGL